MTRASKIQIFAIVFLIILAGLVHTHYKKPLHETNMQNEAINLKTNFYDGFNFGFKRLIVAMLWIKTLMDSDLEHYNKPDFNNWIYLRFNAILNMDPKFRMAYLFGGQYLSIVKDDKVAAKDIYDRGLKVYSDDYYLNFYAAYHYLFELQDYQGALRLYNKIKFHPRAPHYIASIVAKLKLQTSSAEAALALIQESLSKAPKDSPIYEKLAQSFYELKTQIDLDCLNSGSRHCPQKDIKGLDYILDKKSGRYKSPADLRPFKIFKKKTKN
jgi:tetratricopeptide (TPR) repeat protein